MIAVGWGGADPRSKATVGRDTIHSTMERGTTDTATIVAIAVVVYALANLAHEGLGHGGACLLAGGKPQVLSSVHFESDESLLTPGGLRLLNAGGTVVNLALGGFALVALKFGRWRTHARFFLWLFFTVNLFQAAGYLLFSGIANIGDWAVVIAGMKPVVAWRTGLATLGALAYVGVARLAAADLAPLLGSDGRQARARRLAATCYWTGGLLYCVSGLFNPVGPLLLLISAAAASFGGTSGLLWFHEFLKGTGIPASPDEAVVLDRRAGWLIAAAITAVVFVGILGRGIRF
jgi:hypothetical protein